MRSIYKDYTEQEIENVLSQFLINRWSYSRVSQFSRNEKAFEMSYIYGCEYKNSASTVSGQAYHKALESYFVNKKDDIILTLSDLEIIAFDYIENVEAKDWKIQKTTPTVDECKKKSFVIVKSLLLNFVTEKSVYEDDIKEILSVEQKFTEFLNINGVDIPMPCVAVIDLIVRTKRDTIAIVDHKSKAFFSNEQELKLSIGRQSITYVKCLESFNGMNADEVWFIENKYSKNRDGSPQLNKFTVEISTDTAKLYEALLYEPLKRMLEATNDPDYVYIMNDSDNFIDKAEMYEFWAKTMIAEVDDFNIDPSKKDIISKRLKKIRNASVGSINPTVIKNFKENASSFIKYDLNNKNMSKKEKIEHILRTFGIITNVEYELNGYSSDTFLLEMSAGVKTSSIFRYKLDIANVLNVKNVRISKELVVYNDASFISIEVSKKRENDLIWDKNELNDLNIPIGKDNFNNTIVWDLNNHSTPHVLMCGSTGSGKSVSIMSTIKYCIEANIENIYIFDPKHEFTNLKGRCIVKNEIDEIEATLKELVEDMKDRTKTGKKTKTVVIFDEFADAIAMSRKGKELDITEMQQVGFFKQSKSEAMFSPPQPKMKLVTIGKENSLEENLKMLLQKGRSLGFRIMCATQRASVKVITGDAKVNFPVQICFRVPKEVDSKVVIDEAGAEQLAGAGDGLINSPEYSEIKRFQAFYSN